MASWWGFEYFKRSPYDWQDLGIIKDQIDTINGQWRLAGWPALYTIPNRNASGAVAGAGTTIADPQCAQFSATTFEAGAPVVRRGVSYPSNCVSSTSFRHGSNADETRFQAMIKMRYDLAEDITSSAKRSSCVPARKSATTRPPPWRRDRASPA